MIITDLLVTVGLTFIAIGAGLLVLYAVVAVLGYARPTPPLPKVITLYPEIIQPDTWHAAIAPTDPMAAIEAPEIGHALRATTIRKKNR